MTRDAVCGMRIEPGAAAGWSLYMGNLYHFCAPSCKRMFDAAPDKYVTAGDGKDQPDAFDPVCGTKIDNITTAERGEHAGKTYYFCCVGCKQLFDTIPEMYMDSVDDDTVTQQQPNQ